jgi:NAD(P)-dependent dehydrogenase (short-subunit alcohol dehydrogenase family)
VKLENMTAIVTGAASGLGEATARRLVAGGANVIIADLNEEGGQKVAAELGDKAHFVKTDVTSESNAEACVQAAIDTFGGLNTLVNCAGILVAKRTVGRSGPFPLEDFSKVIQVNLIGTFNMIRLAGAKMMENEPNDEGERGIMVMTSSVAAYDGQIGQAAYSASKGGVAGMTLPIARDFSRFGIRVMTVAPGIFETPMMASLSEAARESLGQQVPFPSRLGRPAEYAQLVESIIQNPMLNGEVIRLDGAIRLAPK